MAGFLLGTMVGLLVGSMTATGWGRWAFVAGARALAMELIRAEAISPGTAARAVEIIGEQGRRLP